MIGAPLRHRTARWFVGGVAWICLLCASSLRASVVVPLSLPQMIAAADLIADGEVVAVHHTDASGRVERIVTVRVLEAWKGSDSDLVHVRLAGGVVGRTRVIVPGVPEVAVGSHVVWFLVREDAGTFAVVGLHQGALRVSTSPVDGRALVSPIAGRGQTGRVVRGDGSRPPQALERLRADVLALRGAAQ